MNAASKGHLPVVRYLLTKQAANPLVRNNWGETAYDVAAAVFEVWICEVRTLQFDPLTLIRHISGPTTCGSSAMAGYNRTLRPPFGAHDCASHSL